MIINTDDDLESSKSITSFEGKSSVTPTTPGLDEPPPYSPPGLPQLPSRIKPVNHLSVTRTGDTSLQDAFLVDPALSIPSALLSTSSNAEGKRLNLFLETKKGAIDADVWIFPGAAAALKGRECPGAENTSTYMEAKSQHGSICLRLNSHKTMRPPLHLTASSALNSVTVYLPRTFRGTLYTKGKVDFSENVNSETVVLEDADGVQRAWVGEFDDPSDNGGPVGPSSLYLTAPEGVITLAYVDEQAATTPEIPVTIGADSTVVDPREPVVDLDVNACPKGLVSWIIKCIERKVSMDVKIEMNVLSK